MARLRARPLYLLQTRVQTVLGTRRKRPYGDLQVLAVLIDTSALPGGDRDRGVGRTDNLPHTICDLSCLKSRAGHRRRCLGTLYVKGVNLNARWGLDVAIHYQEQRTTATIRRAASIKQSLNLRSIKAACPPAAFAYSLFSTSTSPLPGRILRPTPRSTSKSRRNSSEKRLPSPERRSRRLTKY